MTRCRPRPRLVQRSDACEALAMAPRSGEEGLGNDPKRAKVFYAKACDTTGSVGACQKAGTPFRKDRAAAAIPHRGRIA